MLSPNRRKGNRNCGCRLAPRFARPGRSDPLAEPPARSPVRKLSFTSNADVMRRGPPFLRPDALLLRSSPSPSFAADSPTPPRRKSDGLKRLLLSSVEERTREAIAGDVILDILISRGERVLPEEGLPSCSAIVAPEFNWVVTDVTNWVRSGSGQSQQLRLNAPSIADVKGQTIKSKIADRVDAAIEALRRQVARLDEVIRGFKQRNAIPLPSKRSNSYRPSHNQLGENVVSLSVDRAFNLRQAALRSLSNFDLRRAS